MARDKKIFLLDKGHYDKKQVAKLTEDTLEKMVSKEEYNDNLNIIKIDANGYSSPKKALSANGYDFEEVSEDYHVILFF